MLSITGGPWRPSPGGPGKPGNPRKPTSPWKDGKRRYMNTCNRAIYNPSNKLTPAQRKTSFPLINFIKTNDQIFHWGDTFTNL